MVISMSNVVRMTRQPAPSMAVAEEFGLELFTSRIDPSDPEECQEHLFDLYPNRLREIIANRESAMDIAGQLYINKVRETVAEVG